MRIRNTSGTLIAAVLMFSSISTLAEGAPQGLPAEVVKARKETVTNDIHAVGTLRGNETVTLRPELTAIVESIAFEEGSKVKKGAVLIQLDDDQYRAQVKEAEARVRQSGAENRRIQKLFQNGVGSETDRDTSLAAIEINEAQLDLARLNLAKTRITAPFAGITGLRMFSPGDYINAGTELLELVDISRMKVDFAVPEIHLSRVSVGQPLEVRLAAFPGETFAGKITAISPLINERGRSIQVRGEIDNQEGRLRPGLFAEIRLTTSSQEALTVPEEALIPQGNQYFVYRVKDNTIDMVPVKIQQRKDTRVALSGPLAEGDVVVTAGQLKLQPGSPVTPIFTDGSQPVAGGDNE